MKKLIDSLREAWLYVKGKFHITSAVQIVDDVVLLAGKAEATAEEINAVVAVLPIPEPIKTEVKSVIALAIPILKTLANEPQLKNMFNDVRESLAVEIANIISGKVHDLGTIKADIQSIFNTIISEVKSGSASPAGTVTAN